MAERHDYVALEWVKGEIQETLLQARQALEAFVENPEDSARLRFCLAYLHQVSGTLHMVEFYGAALLAEEMESLASALVDETAPASEENLSILMQAILQLPNYLDQVRTSHHDLPVVLLPILNDLRSARGEPMMSETALFNPNMAVAHPKLPPVDDSKFNDPAVIELLRKLRQMLQYSLIGLFRHQDLENNWKYCQKVFDRLEQLTEGTPIGQLWTLAAALVSGMAEGKIELTSSTKQLLKHLDKTLKTIIDQRAEAFNKYADDELIKNILYYLAKVVDGNSKIAEVQQLYRLNEALPKQEEVDLYQSSMNGPDQDTMDSVVSVLMEELGRIKDGLDIMVRGKVQDADSLSKLLPDIKHVADTMAVLGLGIPRRVLLDQVDIIDKLVVTGENPSDGVLMDIAGALLYVEATLGGLSDEPLQSREDSSRARLDGAQEAVVREARNALEEAKEAITDYISGQFNSAYLTKIPSTLFGVRGGLMMVPLERAAGVVGGCSKYIDKTLCREDYRPEWSDLDTLADALMGVEYYLERMAQDGRDGNVHLLEKAEDSLRSLGISLPKASTAPEPVKAEAVKPESENGIDSEPAAVAEIIDIETASTTQSLEELVSKHLNEPSESAESESVDIEPIDAAQIEVPQSLEPVAAVNPPATESIELPEDDIDLIDEEIIEVFLEEAEEVLEAIKTYFPRYKSNSEDEVALTEFRRAFHTLKGSGRMVGANVIGELAWSIENMLNRLIDGTVKVSKPLLEVVEDVTALIPSLIEAFKVREKPDMEQVQRLSDKAFAIAKNEWQEVTKPASLVDQDTTDSEYEGLPVAVAEPVGSDQLLEIFRAELDNHLAVVEDFTQSQAEAGKSIPLVDKVQRSLHTIKGSAHMAGLHAIADLALPAERMIKELQEWHVLADDEICTTLSEVVTRIRITLACLEADEQEPDDNTAFIEQIKQLHQARLKERHDRSSGTDPDLMSIFMSESMDIMLDAEQIVTHWQNNSISTDEMSRLRKELRTLAGAAKSVELNSVVSLSEALADVYDAVSENEIETGAPFFKAALDGQEALISMMDRLAAGQSIQQRVEIEQQLYALLGSESAEQNLIADGEPVETAAIEEMVPAPAEPTDTFTVEGDAELLSIFLEEAHDILENIGQEYSAWNDNLHDNSHVEALQRELHTLKGGARMAEATPIGDLAHELEFLYEGIADGRYQATGSVVELCGQCHDRLSDMVHDVESSQQCQTADDLVAQINHLRRNPKLMSQAVEEELPQAPVAEEDDDTEELESFDETEQALSSDAWQLDLDENMDLDILEIFIDEANELLLELDSAIHAWRAEPHNELNADEMKRVLHTLKGGARLARLSLLADKSHEFETFIINAQRSKAPLDDRFFTQVIARNDQLVAGVESLQQKLQQQGFGGAVGPSVIAQVEDLDDEAVEQLAQQLSVDDTPSNVVPFQKKDEPEVVEAKGPQRKKPSKKGRGQPQETVKVGANLLEGLVNLAGETSISRSRLEQQVSDFGFTLEEMEATIDRLREQVRRLDNETETQIIFRQERAEESGYQDFDPLEMDRYSAIQQLSRSMLESASDLIDLKASLVDKTRDAETLLLQQSRINTELQEGLMQTRMVPFNRLVPRLRRIVRQVSSELGKHVDLHVHNGDSELDRSVLERMISPLEHMLRNAVDHGIEMPDQREAAGKNENGTIEIFVNREGGDAIIRIVDDGAGINIANVRKKAEEKGLITADEHVDDQEVLQFILDSGFSTAEKVTQISGRGVGMDVVHSEVKQLGGNMVIDTELGRGTEFSIRLPVTVSVNRALMVASGDDHYALPLDTIEGIVRVPAKQVETMMAEDAAPFDYAGNEYRVSYLGALLGSDHHSSQLERNEHVPLILVRGNQGMESIALQVDSLMGSREIVVKPLGPQFTDVAGVSGATILGDGSVVVILDLSAMVRTEPAMLGRTGTDAVVPLPSGQQAIKDVPIVVEQDRPTTVMVVDDSVTVRKVTSRLLERHGMDVIVAKDGADAMLLLQDHTPDLMLLDIEMPRMDGFEVANRVRHDSRLKDVPIIMITSRTGSKHRDRALSIGVNEYMGKPFQEGPLLEAIERLVNESRMTH